MSSIVKSYFAFYAVAIVLGFVWQIKALFVSVRFPHFILLGAEVALVVRLLIYVLGRILRNHESRFDGYGLEFYAAGALLNLSHAPRILTLAVLVAGLAIALIELQGICKSAESRFRT